MIKKIILSVLVLALMIVGSNSQAQNNYEARLRGLLDIPASQLPQVIAFMDALDNIERNRMLAADRNEGTIEEKIRYGKGVKLNHLKMMSAPPRCENIKQIAVNMLEKQIELIELSKKQERGLKGKEVPYPNSNIYNETINLSEEYKAERNEIMLEIYGNSKADYDENSFFGNWYSTKTKKVMSISRGGSWKMVTNTGDWHLDDGNFVWTYSKLGPRVQDKTPVLHVEKTKFVLQEEDGYITVFYKTN